MSHRFFKLSIHRQSYDKYYEFAELDKEKMMESMESNWGKPYDEIPREIRIDAENRCWWPPWAFNAIVGYVDVGIDIGVRLTGNVFLMRRYFPKDSRENRYRKLDSKTKKDQILYFRELGPHKVDLRDNASFVAGVNAILAQAEAVIQGLCKTRKYKWVLERLPFSLECIDFVRVASEVKSKLRVTA